MRFKGFYLFFCFFSFGFAQNDVSEVSRNEIFDRLEARAKSLANRMQEMAEQQDTSEPASPSNFPKAYTSPVFVPAPQASQTAVPISDPSESTRVEEQRPQEPLPDASTFTTIEQDNAEYIPTASSQELNGDYYIMPSLGFVLSSESRVSYKFGLNNEVKDLDNEIGTGVGLKAGIRFENFFTEFGIKYTSSDFKIHGALNSGRTTYTGDGIADILNFNARLGYTFQINEQLGLSGSAGLGLANRKNSIDISVGPISGNIGSSETVLSYDVGFSLCYLINESHLLSLGYNYANVAKISQFDALNLHYFELGWGINF
jgi:hypothetical protein